MCLLRLFFVVAISFSLQAMLPLLATWSLFNQHGIASKRARFNILSVFLHHG